VSDDASLGETVPLAFSDDVFLTKTSNVFGQTLPINGGLHGGSVIIAARAPEASITGRVVDTDSRGVRNAIVTLTDAEGATRTVVTSSFGDYAFDAVDTAGTYVITVQSKRYRYSPHVVRGGDGLANVDFVPVE